MSVSLDRVYRPAGYNENYSECVKTVANINPRLRSEGFPAPGDESFFQVLRLYQELGQPLDNIPVIHVGGTNGKGSVSYKIFAALKESGRKVGLFVSPHLACFRERLQINDEMISEDDFVSYFSNILDLCVNLSIPASTFEVTFLAAAVYFQNKGCDAVVLEVGMGGDFDATNVVSTALSIICSVSLDHVRVLGSTVEAIGKRKAGIFKANKPALIGSDCPIHVMEEMASEKSCHLFPLEKVLREMQTQGTLTPMLRVLNLEGTHTHLEGGNSSVDNIGSLIASVDTDELNTLLSLASLELINKYRILGQFEYISNECILHSLRRRPPCRWEHMDFNENIKIVFDVGHNIAAITALCNRIRKHFQGYNISMVFSMSRDKDFRSCLREIGRLELLSSDKLTFVQSTCSRSLPVTTLARTFIEETGKTSYEPKGTNFEDIINEIIEIAKSDSKENGKKSVVLVCGSCYIMSAAKRCVGIIEPRDEE